MLHLPSSLPHCALRDLAKKHGPLTHLQLGETSAIVVSSPQMTMEVLKTHDLSFKTRPEILATKIVAYNNTIVSFASYGDYWREMRKICTLELLSPKKALSFCSIREDEILNNIINKPLAKGKSDDAQEEDLLAVLPRLRESGGLQFPITSTTVKAIFLDMFSAGSDTLSTTIGWAMSELIRNPGVMEKAQS
ncbi:hypothetical protein LguiA_015199 [Lonicera macranthoides]